MALLPGPCAAAGLAVPPADAAVLFFVAFFFCHKKTINNVYDDILKKRMSQHSQRAGKNILLQCNEVTGENFTNYVMNIYYKIYVYGRCPLNL